MRMKHCLMLAVHGLWQGMVIGCTGAQDAGCSAQQGAFSPRRTHCLPACLPLRACTAVPCTAVLRCAVHGARSCTPTPRSRCARRHSRTRRLLTCSSRRPAACAWTSRASKQVRLAGWLAGCACAHTSPSAAACMCTHRPHVRADGQQVQVRIAATLLVLPPASSPPPADSEWFHVTHHGVDALMQRLLSDMHAFLLLPPDQQSVSAPRCGRRCCWAHASSACKAPPSAVVKR